MKIETSSSTDDSGIHTINARKSTYDNQHDSTSTNNSPNFELLNSDSNDHSDLSSDLENPHKEFNFITEIKITKNSNLTNNIQERDDFDDLIDLTHRVPIKIFKKETNSVHSSPLSLRKAQSKNSSLPPLPYSFIKLDKAKSISSNSNIIENEDIKINKQSTVRLIIPSSRSLTSNTDILKENTNFIANSSNDLGHDNNNKYSYSNNHKSRCDEFYKKDKMNKSNKKLEPDKKNSKNDVVHEWDQISKIFASLETLLNEVVESTSKSLETSRNSSASRTDSYKTLTCTDKEFRNKKKLVKNTPTYSGNRTMSVNDLVINSMTNKKNIFKKGLSPISAKTNIKNMKILKHIEICEFLKRLNLTKYEFKFLTNGYDDINFINNVITLQDLLQIDIKDYNDIFLILNEIKKLPSAIKQITNENLKFDSIIEWLNYLGLKEYLENFMMNNIDTMEKVNQLWEIELTTVLQIPFIGHRRRLIAAIQECLKLENLYQNKNDNHSESIDIIDLHINPSPLNTKRSTTTSSNTPTISQSIYKNEDTSSIRNGSNTSYSSYSGSQTPLLNKKLKIVKMFSEPNIDSPRKKRNCSLDAISNKNVLNKTFDNRTLTKQKNPYDHSTNLNLTNYNNNSYTNDPSRFPKPIWANDPQHLIKSSYNFIVYYLGSSAIARNKNSDDPIKYTIDRLKNTSKCTPYPLPKVELAISINGVKLLNYKTKDLLCNYDIKHINNVCQDQDDLNYFAFSTQSDPSAHYYCHVFSCKDNILSTQVILTIGQAFDIAYELFCKNNFN